MVFKKRNLILLVIILLGFTCGVTYAYFGTDIIKDKINPLGIRTGELYINIDDEEIHLDKMAPIYDNDYEHGFKKSFDIVLDSNQQLLQLIVRNILVDILNKLHQVLHCDIWLALIQESCGTTCIIEEIELILLKQHLSLVIWNILTIIFFHF